VAHQVGDDEDGDDDEDSIGYAVEELNTDQRPGGVGEDVENSAKRKNAETDERRGFRRRTAAVLPIQEALPAMTSWVTMMQADMNGALSFGLPRASISPSSGSMAALARWKRKQQTRKNAKVRLVRRAR
jgi:hypothetical protein